MCRDCWWIKQQRAIASISRHFWTPHRSHTRRWITARTDFWIIETGGLVLANSIGSNPSARGTKFFMRYIRRGRPTKGSVYWHVQVRKGGGGVLMNAVSHTHTGISDIQTRWRNSIKIGTPIQISRWNTQPDTRFFVIIKRSSILHFWCWLREHKAYGPIIPSALWGHRIPVHVIPAGGGRKNRGRKLNSKGVDDGKRKTSRGGRFAAPLCDRAGMKGIHLSLALPFSIFAAIFFIHAQSSSLQQQRLWSALKDALLIINKSDPSRKLSMFPCLSDFFTLAHSVAVACYFFLILSRRVFCFKLKENMNKLHVCLAFVFCVDAQSTHYFEVNKSVTVYRALFWNHIGTEKTTFSC